MNTPYWFSNLMYWSAQVALLVLAAGFLPHLFKICQPRVLLVYWRSLIAAALLLPFAQPWHRPESFTTINFTPRIDEFTPIVIATSAPPVSHWYLPSAQIVAAIIGLIILAGIIVRFTILALGLVKLRQFRRASSPISTHAESSAVLNDMRIRVNTGGEFRISSDVQSPVTFGLAAPVILLPERFPSLDAQYQSAIACHELLHVRRRDWAHHLSEEILRAALWFHPAIAWLISRIRLSREQVVDLEVVKLTDARKPYLEALLEFTNSSALATAIPAPPFLVERQLAERVALMLKDVRMSRTRLIASLTAIAACLAVVATLAVWTFPLKAAPKYSIPPIQSSSKLVVQVSPGIVGVTVGVTQSVPAGDVEFVPSGGVTNGIANGVPGGVVGGVTNGVSGGAAVSAPTQGVKGGTSGGVNGTGPATLTDSYVGPAPGGFGRAFWPTFSRKLPLDAASAQPQPAPKIIVTDIKFVGEVHDADAVRSRILQWSQGRIWDGSNNEWLEELAEVGVRGDFQNHGYFEAVVDGVKSQALDSSGSQQRVLATFNVKEGDQFRVAGFSIVADDPARTLVIPTPELREQTYLHDGDLVNVDELRQGITRMTQLYGARGYMDATIVPNFSIDHKTGTIGMTFKIQEGVQYHVTSFTVHGLDSSTTANLESKIRPGSMYDNSLVRQLFDQGNAASGANARWVDVIHIKRNVEAGTVDVSLDFPPKPPPPPAPSNSNDSRYIGKFQVIPPATASSGTVKNIPPVVTSSPSRGLIVPGQPPPTTNQGVFLNVAPSEPANSRSPKSQTNSCRTFVGENGVCMPVCKHCPNPEYSQQARDARIQGEVYLQVAVLTSGRAGEIELTQGLEKSLDEQAIKIIRDEWTFKPATDRNGNPVDMIVPVEISFQLFGPPQPTPQSTGRSAAASPATARLTSDESLQAKIFTAPVTDNGKSTPSYMGLVNAQTIYAPQPEVPRLARQANIHGTVTVNIIVNTEGKVIAVEYVKGPVMLVQAATDTVRNWIIKGTHEGAPVTFQMSVEVGFSDAK